jgi:hypothetical protein
MKKVLDIQNDLNKNYNYLMSLYEIELNEVQNPKDNEKIYYQGYYFNNNKEIYLKKERM